MKAIARRNSWMQGIFVWIAKYNHFLAFKGFRALRKHAPQGCHMERGRGDQTPLWKGSLGKSVHSSVLPCLCPVSVSGGSCHIKMCSAPAFLLYGCTSETSVGTWQIPVVWWRTWVREKGWYRQEQINGEGHRQVLHVASGRCWWLKNTMLKGDLRRAKKTAKAEELARNVSDDKETWKQPTVVTQAAQSNSYSRSSSVKAGFC